MCYESGWFRRLRTTKPARDEQPTVETMKKPAQPAEPPKAPATETKAPQRDKIPA